MSARPIRVLPALASVPRGLAVLVADDCHEFRQLICEALRRTPGIAIVAEAARAIEAVVQAGRYRPDVVLLDFDLAGADPDRLICAVSKQVPYAALVGFSGYDAEFLRPTARAMLSLHLDKRTPLHQVSARVLELGRAPSGPRRRPGRTATRRNAAGPTGLPPADGLSTFPPQSPPPAPRKVRLEEPVDIRARA